MVKKNLLFLTATMLMSGSMIASEKRIEGARVKEAKSIKLEELVSSVKQDVQQALKNKDKARLQTIYMVKIHENPSKNLTIEDLAGDIIAWADLLLSKKDIMTDPDINCASSEVTEGFNRDVMFMIKNREFIRQDGKKSSSFMTKLFSKF